MYEINKYNWAMVELHFEYKGSQKRGQLWWSANDDVLYRDKAGNKWQWYKVTQFTGEKGTGINIQSMTKISNSEVSINIPGFEA